MVVELFNKVRFFSSASVLAAIALSLIFSDLLGKDSMGWQVIVAITALAIGIPHGALDHLITLPKSQPMKMMLFVTVYVAIAILAVIGILKFNTIGFWVVLLMSAIHFGVGDAAFINEIDNSPYYVDYLLNFGINEQYVAVNLALNKDPEGYEILFKLYQPLPLSIEEKQTLWVVEEKTTPYEFDINLDKLITIVNKIESKLFGHNYVQFFTEIEKRFESYVDYTNTDTSLSLIHNENIISFLLDYNFMKTKMQPFLEELVAAGKSVNIRVNINTNLTLITQEKLNFLANNL